MKATLPKFIGQKPVNVKADQGKKKEEKKVDRLTMKLMGQTAEEIEMKDPNSVFRNQVARIVRDHWHITEPLKCSFMEQERKSTFFAKAPSCCPTDKQSADDEYVIQVRHVAMMQSEEIKQHKFDEEREMRSKRFADHCERMDLPLGAYIAPGVITTEGLQISVHQKHKGKHLTPELCKNKDLISAVGTYLAKFHQCSRKFKVMNPNWRKEYSVQRFDWGTAPKDMPEDDLHFGLIHGSFHCGNYLVDFEGKKDPSEIEVACFDFDDMRPSYFISDLIYAINIFYHRVGKDLAISKQIMKWLVDAYVKQTQKFGWTDYKITKEHLIAFAFPELKDLFNDVIPSQKAGMQKYVQRMKESRAGQK